MDNKTAFTNAFSPINFVVGTSLFLLPVVAMLNVWSDADMVVKLGLLGLAGLGLYFLSRSSESLLKVLENGFEVDETVGGAGFNWEFATPLKKEWQDYVIILSPFTGAMKTVGSCCGKIEKPGTMVLLIIRNPDRREELLERHKSMVDALIDLDGAGYVDFPYNVGHLNHITERFKDF